MVAMNAIAANIKELIIHMLVILYTHGSLEPSYPVISITLVSAQKYVTKSNTPNAPTKIKGTITDLGSVINLDTNDFKAKTSVTKDAKIMKAYAKPMNVGTKDGASIEIPLQEYDSVSPQKKINVKIIVSATNPQSIYLGIFNIFCISISF